MKVKYIETVLAATLFGWCAYVGLMGKPQPPNYSGWERDVVCMFTGGFGFMYLTDVWTGHPEMRIATVLLIILAIITALVVAVNNTMFFKV